jgi:hypothetical protein
MDAVSTEVREDRIGLIEEGYFKGRRIIIPDDPTERIVWVEKGMFAGDAPRFERACLIHDIWVGNGVCKKCTGSRRGSS